MQGEMRTVYFVLKVYVYLWIGSSSIATNQLLIVSPKYENLTFLLKGKIFIC